jgi:alpha-tubulin suppressor-like RCC1 family protein
VLAWGRNANGEAGDGTTGDDKLVPVMASLGAGTSVTSIGAGCEYSLARTSGGRVLAWGADVVGELGNGKTATSALPVRVKLPAGREATVIGTGPDADTSLAITRKAVM